MASEYLTFSGKCKWAQKLVHPDMKFKKWGVQLYLDTLSLDKFKQTVEKYGLKNHLKKDDEGYFVNFSRPTEKIIRGKNIAFAPPRIVYNDQPFIGTIGNGSDVTLIVELYSYKDPYGKPGYAIRLESVRVDNLIEYNAQRDALNDQDREAYQRTSEAPKPLF